MKPNFDEINGIIKDLPATALSLMPDDMALIFLTGALPTQITEANAKITMTILSLICRRVAVLFDGMAAAQERVIQDL